MQQQENELLKELRDKRDVKLKRLMKELDGVNFYVAKACSLQVGITTIHISEDQIFLEKEAFEEFLYASISL